MVEGAPLLRGSLSLNFPQKTAKNEGVGKGAARKLHTFIPIEPFQPPKIVRRFWEKVQTTHRDECWPWTASFMGSGYGRFKLSSYTQIPAHRFAYAVHYRTDPGPYMVCHRCDNPKCCNPHHLFLGTALNNNLDKIRKGRAYSGDQSGENNPAARLKEAHVRRIKTMIRSGMDNTTIAEQFDVTHSMISRIRLGKSWAHVE